LAENLKGRDHLEGYYRMDLKEIGLEGVDWILPAEDKDQW
jgi:hypothetical protein